MRIDSSSMMEALGARLAPGLVAEGGVVHLRGPLGAGKTTLVRGLLRALGHAGSVKSPTYTLIESYAPGALHIHHLDLYRLKDPEELEFIGLRDLLEPGSACLIEWPERGAGAIPAADLEVVLGIVDDHREVFVHGPTPRGERILESAGIPVLPAS